jgi:ComF family protein
LAGLLCPVCATPLTTPAPACGACLKTPPAFDATLAPLRYAFPVDRLIQHLKFARRLASADFCAQCMLAGTRPQGTLIVPVPLSPLHLHERGFNQALEIARPLARTLGLPLDATSLLRTRETLPQTRLPWRARKGNVRHAFESRRDFSSQTVIVIDDVMTTGATLDAVARTLKDHGATRVVNWVAARAVRTIP